jgi:uncharacterized protein (DUF305 family)
MARKRNIIALATVIALALLAFGTGTAFARGGMGLPGGMGPGPGMMGGDADRHFIERMIPHHEDAIAMADLAATRAGHQDIKDLAATIKATQAAEIDQMRAWYLAWYGTDVPAVPAMGGMVGRGMMGGQDVTTLSKLSGDAFDRAFIEQMVPHHQMGVHMATMTLPQSTHPELQGLLQSIVATQSAEIAQMQRWYQAWYGAAAPSTQCGTGAMPGMGTTPGGPTQHGPMQGPGRRGPNR